MARRRIFWRLFAVQAVVLGALAATVLWTSAAHMRSAREEQLRSSLANWARLLARDLEGALADTAPREPSAAPSAAHDLRSPAVLAVANDLGRVTSASVEVIDPTNLAIVSSSQSLSGRLATPEVRGALAGQSSADARYQPMRRQRELYVAQPVVVAGETRAVVRLGLSLLPVDREVTATMLRLAALFGGALVATAVAANLGARVIVRQLQELETGIAALGGGDLSRRFGHTQFAELGQLAEALNAMARQLEQWFQRILRQNQQQEAVLASMVEGVLAVDTEHRIISLNRAAARLLETHPSEVQGRNLQEIVRNADLRHFVSASLAAIRPIEGDIVLRTGRDRVLQVHGTALRGSGRESIGAVVVLNDVTRLRALETMRRDFAANVSHELKTPITSIKGFVETLLDGAMHNPQDTDRFLRIVQRQADRLSAIIEDLLSLAKIERQGETADIELVEGPIGEVLQAAWHDVEPIATQRGVQIEVRCPDDLRAAINPPLLQQAVTNLLDNAIKYSEPQRHVWLEGRSTGTEVQISVTDQGCGIADEHLSRLFERFYRVDKARSRKLGGTGLGLAIVKHIVIAHRGTVHVQSKPGHGSCFTIALPR